MDLLRSFHTRYAIFSIFSVLLLLAGCQTVPQNKLTAEQIAVLKEQGFLQTEAGWELGLSNKVLFGNNVAKLSQDSQREIAKMGRALSGVGLKTLRVDGHTDDQGENDYNNQLSLRRATAVAEVLIAAGIPRESVMIRGLGKKAPVASNRTAAGRAENRRVSIVVSAG